MYIYRMLHGSRVLSNALFVIVYQKEGHKIAQIDAKNEDFFSCCGG